MIATKKQNPLDRIFVRLYRDKTKPYNLPLFKVFPAPVDATKFDAFFATLQANGWDVDAAITPYKDEEQMSVCAFHDAILDEYRFCPTTQFWRLNGIHIALIEEDE